MAPFSQISRYGPHLTQLSTVSSQKIRGVSSLCISKVVLLMRTIGSSVRGLLLSLLLLGNVYGEPKNEGTVKSGGVTFNCTSTPDMPEEIKKGSKECPLLLPPSSTEASKKTMRWLHVPVSAYIVVILGMIYNFFLCSFVPEENWYQFRKHSLSNSMCRFPPFLGCHSYARCTSK